MFFAETGVEDIPPARYVEGEGNSDVKAKSRGRAGGVHVG
jgi:hypothetical protein